MRRPVLTRAVQSLMTAGGKRTPDETRKKRRHERVGAAVPRDSRSGVPEREAASRPRRAPFAIQRARVLNPIKTLPESLSANGVYVKGVRFFAEKSVVG
ncbi:MAG: hypothetical protein LBG43_07480 [Treponema sp.]|nr:hypothetical protein [Treponema sp.]